MRVENDIRRGIPQKKNLRNKQRAIFIDRDGTINKPAGFLSRLHDFELIESAADCIRNINQSGYLAICITNQPVIARGELTVAGLHEIHNKMETLLGLSGAYLDDIFYCPHHPDGGFAGEVAELKINCGCRKPQPGLLYAASQKYNIDLSQSVMVGDSLTDKAAGRRAGCAKYYPSLTGLTEIL